MICSYLPYPIAKNSVLRVSKEIQPHTLKNKYSIRTEMMQSIQKNLLQSGARLPPLVPVDCRTEADQFHNTTSSEPRQRKASLSTSSTTNVNLSDSKTHRCIPLVLHICNMSPLPCDSRVVHPFVSVWVVDSNTGCSLTLPLTKALGEGIPQTAPNYGSSIEYDSYSKKDHHVFFGYTHPHDLRLHRTTAPAWDEHLTLFLHDDGEEELESALLIFELLDFGSSTLFEWNSTDLIDISSSDDDDESSFNGNEQSRTRRIPLQSLAWGFITWRDAYGRPNVCRPQFVELFNPPSRRSWNGSILAHMRRYFTPVPQSSAVFGNKRNEANGPVPQVFHELMLDPVHRCDLYGASLRIAMYLPAEDFVPTSSGAVPYEQKLLHTFLMRWFSSDSGRSHGDRALLAEGRSSLAAWITPLATALGVTSMAKSARYRRQQRKAILLRQSFERKRAEVCLPPTETLHTIGVPAGETVSALAFSPNHGSHRLLVVSVVSAMHALIRIYDLYSVNCEIVGVLQGHTDYIHSLAFSFDGNKLLSGSSDRTARCWDGLLSIPLPSTKLGTDIPRITASRGLDPSWNADVRTNRTMAHTAPVIGAVWAGEALTQAVVTATGDGHLHVWNGSSGHRIMSVSHGGVLFKCLAVSTADKTLATDQLYSSRNNVKLRLKPNSLIPGKVYTLDACGFLISWRLRKKEDSQLDHFYNDLAPRRKLLFPGALMLEISENVALITLTGPRGPSFVTVDLIPFAVLTRTSLSNGFFFQPKFRGVLAALLPDSRTIVVPHNAASFEAYDVSGDLLTSNEGHSSRGHGRKLQGFPIMVAPLPVRMVAWCRPDHIAAVVCDASSAAGAPIVISVAGRFRQEQEPDVSTFRTVASTNKYDSSKFNESNKIFAPTDETPLTNKKPPRSDKTSNKPETAPAQQYTRGWQEDSSLSRIEQITKYWKNLVSLREKGVNTSHIQ